MAVSIINFLIYFRVGWGLPSPPSSTPSTWVPRPPLTWAEYPTASTLTRVQSVSTAVFWLFHGKSEMIKAKREDENSYKFSKIRADINDAGGKS